jgi:16S rRNA G527 N7-methylase RsmG
MKPSVDPIRIAKATGAIVRDALVQLAYVRPNLEFFRQVEAFAATLALWGSKLNLTSAPEDPDEIAFHIVDSLAPLIFLDAAVAAAQHPGCTHVATARPDPQAERVSARTEQALNAAQAKDDDIDALCIRVLDLGSGAGFPSLILAAACGGESGVSFTLIESRRKRASFLNVAAAEMGLTNLRVNPIRIDPSIPKPLFDVVTARAFAEPAMVYATATAALKPGGRVIIYAGPAQRPAIESAGANDFEAPVFINYEVPRGATTAVHLLSVAKFRK